MDAYESEPLFQEGMSAVHKQDFDAAEAKFRSLLSRPEYRIRASRSLGALRMTQGRFLEAIPFLEAAYEGGDRGAASNLVISYALCGKDFNIERMLPSLKESCARDDQSLTAFFLATYRLRRNIDFVQMLNETAEDRILKISELKTTIIWNFVQQFPDSVPRSLYDKLNKLASGGRLARWEVFSVKARIEPEESNAMPPSDLKNLQNGVGRDAHKANQPAASP